MTERSKILIIDLISIFVAFWIGYHYGVKGNSLTVVDQRSCDAPPLRLEKRT